jgi:hypothetical protein
LLRIRAALPLASRVDALWNNAGLGWNRIDPHRSTFPPLVEQAVCALALQPWKEFMANLGVGCKPFSLRWVYTVRHDAMSKPSRPRSPNSLSWAPHFTSTDEVDYYPAETFILKEGKSDAVSKGISQTWELLERVSRAPAFNRLVKHFIARAMESKGIDSFISLHLAIEACLSIEKEENATSQLGRRVRKLTNDMSSKNKFHSLYALRSHFLHGREFPTETTLLAESVADLHDLISRSVAAFLQVVDEDGSSDRTTVLSRLAPRKDLSQ